MATQAPTPNTNRKAIIKPPQGYPGGMPTGSRGLSAATPPVSAVKMHPIPAGSQPATPCPVAAVRWQIPSPPAGRPSMPKDCGRWSVVSLRSTTSRMFRTCRVRGVPGRFRELKQINRCRNPLYHSANSSPTCSKRGITNPHILGATQAPTALFLSAKDAPQLGPGRGAPRYDPGSPTLKIQEELKMRHNPIRNPNSPKRHCNIPKPIPLQ